MNWSLIFKGIGGAILGMAALAMALFGLLMVTLLRLFWGELRSVTTVSLLVVGTICGFAIGFVLYRIGWVLFSSSCWPGDYDFQHKPWSTFGENKVKSFKQYYLFGEMCLAVCCISAFYERVEELHRWLPHPVLFCLLWVVLVAMVERFRFQRPSDISQNGVAREVAASEKFFFAGLVTWTIVIGITVCLDLIRYSFALDTVAVSLAFCAAMLFGAQQVRTHRKRTNNPLVPVDLLTITLWSLTLMAIACSGTFLIIAAFRKNSNALDVALVFAVVVPISFFASWISKLRHHSPVVKEEPEDEVVPGSSEWFGSVAPDVQSDGKDFEHLLSMCLDNQSRAESLVQHELKRGANSRVDAVRRAIERWERDLGR